MGFNVDAAKQEYIAERRAEWRYQWRKAYCQSHGGEYPQAVPANLVPEPPKSIEPVAWAASNWGTGGVVIDMEALAKLPETKQRLIFKQIRTFCKGK